SWHRHPADAFGGENVGHPAADYRSWPVMRPTEGHGLEAPCYRSRPIVSSISSGHTIPNAGSPLLAWMDSQEPSPSVAAETAPIPALHRGDLPGRERSGTGGTPVACTAL